ncbi:putative exocyst complex component Exo70 [Rosa chinensis]|uniref:Putative exocyst complex component Exo70 n=1 Tax=Rosa chinensis TaxID=74649 RepID=A0A2P6S107_ROSCH|nr:putative exocyst complex component Exo70 [Rosa chinensis]
MASKLKLRQKDDTSPIEPDSLANHSSSSSSHHFSVDHSSEFEVDDFSVDNDCDLQNTSNYRSTSSIRELDLIPSDAVIDLRNIADRMITEIGEASGDALPEAEIGILD